MASRSQMEHAQPGDILLVVHDFTARSSDELSFTKGDRLELVERDDDFGDGWFLGRHMQNGNTGLFPEVYTTPAPKGTFTSVAPRQGSVSSLNKPVATTNDRRASDASSYDAPAQQYKPPVKATVPYTVDKPAAKPVIPSQQTPSLASTAANAAMNRISIPSTTQRSLGIGGGGIQGSPVMNETLSVIDEHITDMRTPRHSFLEAGRRGTQDSGSEYSSHLDHRLSYINGQETDEEEQTSHNEQEVMNWTPAQVAEYLEDMGVEEQHCRVFREQEITGEVLLGMDQSSIFLKEFDLGPVGRRLRTWQKIRALQQEVSGAPGRPLSTSNHSVADEMASDAGRRRSASLGTMLPRIPTVHEDTETRPMTGSQVQRTGSQVPATIMEHTFSFSSATPPPAQETSPRPSAASVRSLGHNRRHSSIDQTAADSGPSGQTTHRKQPSFDRNWTMGGSYERRSTFGGQQSPVNGRPLSTAHAHSQSSSATNLDRTNRDLSVSTEDVDRGYFSGGEMDNRKSVRNVLKKKESQNHTRNSSYMAEQRKRTSRAGSTDSKRNSISGPLASPTSQAYYGAGFFKGNRVASGPELSKPMVTAKDSSPTVTKLDYGVPSNMDAIATSPTIDDGSSFGGASPSPAMQTQSRFAKARATGLRAISDAITGSEKAFVSLSIGKNQNQPSPVKESPLQSPTRTGSSTPSGTSKSFDFDDASVAKSAATSGSGGLTPSTGTTRRKSKKHTSAYRKGLEKKTPQEQMIGCDYSGWMKKRSSNLMATWKPRLFVLRGCRLSYYYSEHDKEEKGLIDISSHRVLPADNERITGLHATLTGATSSPTSPRDAQTPTSTSTNGSTGTTASFGTTGTTGGGIFIFKLVPPRSGLSKAVNFTKPTVHYFAVDNVQQGRLWMAALMKATIDRDENAQVVTTYNQPTISLAKAKAMKQRPPAFREEGEERRGLGLEFGVEEEREGEEEGASSGAGAERRSVDAGSATTASAVTAPGSLNGDAEK